MNKRRFLIFCLLTIVCLTVNVTVGGGKTSATSFPEGIWVSPESFDVNLIEGTSLSENMVIGNNGTAPIDYQIRTRSVAVSAMAIRQSSPLIRSTQATERLDKIRAASEKGDIFRVPEGRDFTIVDDNVPYKEGELLIRFSDNSTKGRLNTQAKQEILNSLGGGIIKKSFKTVPGLNHVKLPAGMTVKQALKQYNKSGGILYAQPNYQVKILSTIPNDTRFSELWGMNNTGQGGGTVDADIDAPEAWDIATGNGQIVVAVIDTGVDYTHPDLAANMWVNTGEIPGNGIDDDGNGYVDDVYGYDFCNNDGDPMDDHYHGTHCAGTIGAVGNNGQGVAGVCWNVKIMAIKFLDSGGSGWTADAIDSVEYSVLMGANLSSNSWGGGGYDQALKDAINAAGAAGMLFIAAAGNDSSNNDTYPNYPSNYDCSSLIAVASTDKYDNKSDFSNYGLTSVDIGAPGSSILSCKPGNSYQYLSGTSMATPHVSGACALVWSMNPTLSNSEVKDILLRTVDKITSLQGKCVSEGRLNLYKAILETKVPWLKLEPEAGTVDPDETDNISVVFDTNGLAPATYNAEIIIISNDPCNPQLTVPVTMTVKPDALIVNPVDDFAAQGTKGGPFEPTCMKYTLTNSGIVDINWTTIWDANWLAITPAYGMLEPNETVDVNVCLSPEAYLLDPNIFTDQIRFENVGTGSVKKRKASLTVEPPDCFTEFFEEGSNKLSGLMLTFTPNGSSAYYEACRNRIKEFPTDPNGGIYVPLWDDDFAEIIPGGGDRVLFYGNWYDRFYIGSNGYITFGQGDVEREPTLENHFALPRISALFTDLNPSSEYSISYKQLDDRIAVTFEDVPLFGDKDAKNSFQIEMFFVRGQIRISWLNIASTRAAAGLSEGKGMPAFLFKESDLSGYSTCRLLGDLNSDNTVNFADVALFALNWRDVNCCIPFWCGKADLDLNSSVDEGDLEYLIDNWLLIYSELPEPVSHWKLDEGSGTIAYDSAGSNDGTLKGSSAWVAGQVGNYAVYFNDQRYDYVQGANSPFDFADTTFTVCSWFKTNYWVNIVSEGGYLHGGWELSSAAGMIHVQLKEGSPNAYDAYYAWSANVDCNDGKWHHVAAVIKTSTTSANGNDTKIYVDGLPVEFTDHNLYPYSPSTDKWCLGSVGGGSCPYNGCQGSIDDVRIYNQALTDEEILQIYQEGLGNKAYNPHPQDGEALVDPNVILSWTPGKDAIWHDVYLGTDFDDVNNATPDSNEYMGRFDVNGYDPNTLEIATTYYWRVDEVAVSDIFKGNIWSFKTFGGISDYLVSWWKFDEGQGSTAHDAAGNNNGTLYGDATWTTGIIDGGMQFSGNGWVNVPNSSSLNITGEITISVWYKPSTNDGAINYNSQIASKWLGSDNAYTLGYGEIPNYIWLVINANNNVRAYSAVPVNDTNEWYHIAGVYNGSEQIVYINAVPGSSYANTGQIRISSQPLRISGYPSGWRPLHGAADDVRIYNRALTSEEIWQIYQEGLQ